MRPIPPPVGVELEDLELYAAGVNRALQDVPDLQYATIGGQEVELTDMDGVIQAIVVTGHHDELQGVDISVAHTLFLLLDGSRPMTGDLDMAEHDILDVQHIKGDVSVGGTIYNWDLTPTTGLGFGLHPQMTFEWTKAGYTATGQFSPNYRSIDGVTQHAWHMTDGLYVHDSGGGTGNIYVENQFYSLLAGGIAPIKVTSTVMCANLNVDLLDGYHGAEFAALAENELITGDWTFGGSAKAYFNDASATGGTEWIWAPADTILGLVAAGTLRLTAGSAILDVTNPVGNQVRFDSTAGDAIQFYSTGSHVMTLRSSAVELRANVTTIYGTALQFFEGADRAAQYRVDYTFDQFLFTVNEHVGTQLVLTEVDWRAKDHDHPDGPHPLFYYQGDVNPDVSNNAFGYAGHDGTGFVIGSGPEWGAGTVPAQLDNYIMFSPRGTEALRLTGAGGAEFKSGMKLEQATISAAATLTAAHYIVLCDTDTAGAAFTVTLPAVASHADRVYYIKNTGTGGFDVTVDGDGAETIDGDATQTVIDGHCLAIVCDGTEWWVI